VTIALVHGVPETAAVWNLFVDELVALGHDAPLRLSPPGFGAPVPDGCGRAIVLAMLETQQPDRCSRHRCGALRGRTPVTAMQVAVNDPTPFVYKLDSWHT
jgi:hypothetical protein